MNNKQSPFLLEVEEFINKNFNELAKSEFKDGLETLEYAFLSENIKRIESYSSPEIPTDNFRVNFKCNFFSTQSIIILEYYGHGKLMMFSSVKRQVLEFINNIKKIYNEDRLKNLSEIKLKYKLEKQLDNKDKIIKRSKI